MKVFQFKGIFNIPASKFSTAHVKMEAGGGMNWTPTRPGLSNLALEKQKSERGKVRVIIDDFSTPWIARNPLKTIYTKYAARAEAEVKASRQDTSSIRIFYGAHYIQIYKEVNVHEPRVSEVSERVGGWFKNGGFPHFRTIFVTAPMRDERFRGDGMHYQGQVDRMLSYILLSAVCGEIESRVQNGTL
jgi:hypothetical protein